MDGIGIQEDNVISVAREKVSRLFLSKNKRDVFREGSERKIGRFVAVLSVSIQKGCYERRIENEEKIKSQRDFIIRGVDGIIVLNFNSLNLHLTGDENGRDSVKRRIKEVMKKEEVFREDKELMYGVSRFGCKDFKEKKIL